MTYIQFGYKLLKEGIEMASCTHNCSTCSSKCKTEIEFLSLNSNSHIKHIIGIVSGKGGVGKSLFTSLIASKMAKLGYKVGILDADITGPSIPKSFGVSGMVKGNGEGIDPAISKDGIKIMSVNLLIDNPNRPVVFRGPALGSLVSQFYTDAVWGDLDYLFIDMPPGTGDVSLTIFQQIPIDGVIMVSTPQDLVKMIVAKSINMANMLNVKVIGLVENMSYVKCPCCGDRIELFGRSHIGEIAEEFNLKVLASLPIDPKIREHVDNGDIYNFPCYELEELVKEII